MWNLKFPPWASAAILLVALIVGWGWFSSLLVLKPPRLANFINPRQLGAPYEDFEVTTEDGVKIPGWFVPAAQQTKAEATILMCHGWGANRSDILPSTLFLHRAGFHLVYWDFRRHGSAGGKITTLGALEQRDLDAVLGWLKKHKPQQARRIGVYGISMGGSVAIAAAARHPEILAVCSDTPFASFNAVVARFARIFYGLPKYPLIPITLAAVRLRAGVDPEEFSAIRHIGKISPRPVFLIQGEEDKRIPLEVGERLYRAAGEPKELWRVPGADHMEAHSRYPDEYEERVSAFFRKALK